MSEMKQQPEAAALKYWKLQNSGQAGSFKAEMFRRECEERASEQDYQDFSGAVSNLRAYGVC